MSPPEVFDVLLMSTEFDLNPPPPETIARLDLLFRQHIASKVTPELKEHFQSRLQGLRDWTLKRWWSPAFAKPMKFCPMGPLMTRPPDVATIARELPSMHQRIEGGGFVSVTDAYRLADLISAWEFYRDSQPLNYQLHIDALINEISNCAVGAA